MKRRVAPVPAAEAQIEADPAPVRELVGYQLRRAHTLFALHWQLSFRDRERRVTPVQGGMLLIIESRPGLTQSALARLMKIEGPTLLQSLDRLQENGLVRRVQREGDRRSYALQLTDAGREVLAEVKRFVPQREDDLLSELSEGERRQLLDLLQRVVRRSQNAIAELQAPADPSSNTDGAEAPTPLLAE